MKKIKDFKKKLQIGLLLLFTISMTSKSQTSVSGIISSNTTWTQNNSPYIVTGNILLSSGVVLNIEPGVEIKVGNNFGIQIKGTLKARGNANNRITFTSNNSTPSNGDWSYIYFTDFSTDAILTTNGNYVSGCILEYCNVLYSGGLSNGAVYVDNAKPFIRNCNITNSSSHGIYSYIGGFRIDSCNILNNSGSGLHYKYINSDVKIFHNKINNNNQGGIVFEPSASYDSILIYNNEINSNLTNGGINIPTQLGTKKVYILNNNIKNNVGNYGGAINIAGGFIRIECNSIVENKATADGGGIYISYSDQNNTYHISNNYIAGNKSNDSYAIEIASLANSYTCSVYIENNIITKNGPLSTPSIGSVLSLYGFSAYSSLTTFYTNNNLIKENSGKSAIELKSFVGTLHNNNFINNNVTYEIYNNNDIGHNDIDAINNYWNTTNVTIIDNLIYDWLDNSSNSPVSYVPILNTPNPILLNVSDLSCSSIDTSSTSTSTAEIQNNRTVIEVFPNPSNGILYFRNLEKESILGIYDITGKVIFETVFKNNEQTVDFSTKEKGMYIFRVIDSNKEVHQGKIIIQ